MADNVVKLKPRALPDLRQAVEPAVPPVLLRPLRRHRPQPLALRHLRHPRQDRSKTTRTMPPDAPGSSLDDEDEQAS